MVNWPRFHLRRGSRPMRIAAFAALAIIILTTTLTLTYGNRDGHHRDIVRHDHRFASSNSFRIRRDVSNGSASLDKRAVTLVGRADRPAVAGPSKQPQGSKGRKGVAGPGSGPATQQSSSAITVFDWNRLISYSWKLSVPLMIHTIQNSESFFEEWQRRGGDGPRNKGTMVWQKDSRQHFGAMTKAYSGKAQHWDRQENARFDLRPLALALAGLPVPGSQTGQKITVPRAGNEKISGVRYVQSIPWSNWKDNTATCLTKAETALMFPREGGLIVVLSSQDVPSVLRLHRPDLSADAVDLLTPPVRSPSQIVGYEWYANDVLKGYNTQLNYIAVQSVALSETSSSILRQITAIWCESPQANLPAHPQSLEFKVGDPFYHALLALPELKWLAILLAERKWLFGVKVLSAVSVFKGQGDNDNTPSFIWRVESSSPELRTQATWRHYAFANLCVAKAVFNQNYMSLDKSMAPALAKAREIEQNPALKGPQTPDHVVSFVDALVALKKSSAPAAASPEQQDKGKGKATEAADGPGTSNLGANDPVWLADWTTSPPPEVFGEFGGFDPGTPFGMTHDQWQTFW